MHVCVKCHVRMAVDKMAVDFIETTDGIDPYRIWSADRFKCPKCGVMVLSAFGDSPYGFSFDNDFNDIVNSALKREDTVIERK